MMDHFTAAIRNVGAFGDTDVLAFPIENHVLSDEEELTAGLLRQIDGHFETALNGWGPITDGSLIAAGYNGFRWVVQIDPIWNAYLLGLVISIGDEIERKRIPVSEGIIYSYRFKYDEGKSTLFDNNLGWREFQDVSKDRAKGFKYVVACDIADFYHRIDHDQLRSALGTATPRVETVDRIMRVLRSISNGASYGLPVGGPAARLLSELLLAHIDGLLSTKGITFCRYADDYYLFSSTQEEAYRYLRFLAEKLIENEGLSLQKSKTRIMTANEFISASEFSIAEDAREPGEGDGKSLLSLRLRYDPYSATAVEDYEELRKRLAPFDIEEMLSREMKKSRIHQAHTKKLISALRFRGPETRNTIIEALIENLSTHNDRIPSLYPVFPNVMLLIKGILNDLDQELRSFCFEKILQLVESRSQIVNTPANLCYAMRVLSDDQSTRTKKVLDNLYAETSSMMVRRDIILIMARRGADDWIANLTKSFNRLSPWERRSLVVASFILGHQGRKWRELISSQLSPIDKLSQVWAEHKNNPQPPALPPPRDARVFLSYAREDKDKVRELYGKLREAGFQPWMDVEDIPAGADWEAAIESAIDDSPFFLACLSDFSVGKRGILQKEIDRALELWKQKLEDDIYLIPARLNPCELPRRLRKFQWVDIYEADGWSRLLKAIQLGLSKQALQQPSTASPIQISSSDWRIPI
jgi:hypothetical protein